MNNTELNKSEYEKETYKLFIQLSNLLAKSRKQIREMELVLNLPLKQVSINNLKRKKENRELLTKLAKRLQISQTLITQFLYTKNNKKFKK